MSAALLPCPFCGYEAEIERLGDHRQSTIYCCTSCGCTLETGEEWGHGRDWNRRATYLPPGVKISRHTVVAGHGDTREVLTLDIDDAAPEVQQAILRLLDQS
jgi:hypothetical protein